MHLHVRKRSPIFLRNSITEFPKLLVLSNVCAQVGFVAHSTMFDYMKVTGNYVYHTHIYIFVFINSLNWAEMGRKASCTWLGPPHFTN